MKDDKIQTGLRIPQARYEELRVMAERSGTSLNGLILFLVDVGLTTINRSAEEAGRFLPRNP